MNRQMIVLLVVILVGPVNVPGQIPTVPNEDHSVMPPDFGRMSSFEEMYAAVLKVERSNPKPTAEYVAELVRQIRQDQVAVQSKVFPIYLLGYLRTTNAVAVEALIDKIDLVARRGEP